MRSLPRRLFERPGLSSPQGEECRWHESATADPARCGERFRLVLARRLALHQAETAADAG